MEFIINSLRKFFTLLVRSRRLGFAAILCAGTISCADPAEPVSGAAEVDDQPTTVQREIDKPVAKISAPSPESNRHDRSDAEALEPSLSIAVNNGINDLFRGWPLVIQLRITPPRQRGPEAKPFVLSAATGDWSNALTIEIRNEKDVLQEWRLSLARSVEGDLSLGPNDRAQLFWQFDPAKTKGLPEGDYTVSATLDTTKSAKKENWIGRVVSPPVSFSLREEPSPLPPEIVSQKQLLFAWTAALNQRPGDAAAAIDELLSNQPKNLAALTFKADLLAQAGEDREALDLYDKALDVFTERHRDSPEPPTILLAKQNALIAKVLHENEAQHNGTEEKSLATPKSITVDEVLSLLRLEIPSNAILRRLKEQNALPSLTAEQRDALTKAGATADLLKYLDAQEK